MVSDSVPVQTVQKRDTDRINPGMMLAFETLSTGLFQEIAVPMSFARISASIALLTALTMPAQAELTADVGIATEYLRDGISETRGEYAAQGGLTYIHDSGLYANAWASELKHSDDAAHSEWDFSAGASRYLTDTLGVDVGLTRYTQHGDYEVKDKAYTEYFTRFFYNSEWVFGWRHSKAYLDSDFAKRSLELSYTLHSGTFDFEFYTAQHRYLKTDDDFNFGSENRDNYWHFRIGANRTYNQYDYRLTLERTNLPGDDYDAGTTFMFSIHRYFDLF